MSRTPAYSRIAGIKYWPSPMIATLESVFFAFLTVKVCARKRRGKNTCWAPSVKLWAQCGPFRQSLAVARAPVKVWPSESSPSKFAGLPGPYYPPLSKTWSSSVANPLQDLFVRRVAGSSGIVDWLARASSMGQLRHTVGCGSNEQCSQSVRQADTVRCGHAASSLFELVRCTRVF